MKSLMWSRKIRRNISYVASMSGTLAPTETHRYQPGPYESMIDNIMYEEVNADRINEAIMRNKNPDRRALALLRHFNTTWIKYVLRIAAWYPYAAIIGTEMMIPRTAIVNVAISEGNSDAAYTVPT